MLHLEGTRVIAQPLPDVWSKLSDARFLLQGVPGVESSKQADADSAVCVLRPGFAFVRGTLEVTLRIAERTPSTSARIVLHSKGIGSSSDVEAAFVLSPQGEATQVQWTADVTQLGGLLKAVPHGLIRAAAEKVIADAWTAIEARLTAP